MKETANTIALPEGHPIQVYFQEKKRSNLVIWRDQMTELQWKSLKMRVKLH